MTAYLEPWLMPQERRIGWQNWVQNQPNSMHISKTCIENSHFLYMS